MKQNVSNCETVLLGWDAPLLPRVAGLLRQRFASTGELDLSEVICVLPSGRGTDRLRNLVQFEAEQSQLRLLPPELITVGQLASRLFRPPRPIASDFEQVLAWAHVLMQRRAEELRPLLTHVPTGDSITAWLELAGTIQRLHTDLASEDLTFDDVAAASESDQERQRWTLLGELFDAYLGSIDDAGLADPYRSSRQAVDSSQCRSDKIIVLVGTTDLNESLVAMLRSLNHGAAEREASIIALIAAPASDAFRFDEFGNVDTQSWLDHELNIQDHQLVSASDVSDQSRAVTETIADYANRYSADEVTIGVTDESLVAPIEVQLRGCGVCSYRHLGWAISETAVGRLFQLTANHLQRRTWQSLAALVRHSDVHALITEKLEARQGDNDWLIQLDQMLSCHFPVRVDEPLPVAAVNDFPLAARVPSVVDSWLAPLLQHSQPGQPLARWSVEIGKWLDATYHRAKTSPDGRFRTSMALDATRRMIQRCSSLHPRLDAAVSGDGAIEMIAGRLREQRVAESAKPDDVEILGWLDLALDDAPAMVIAGMNHPFVPAAVTSDPFLPGSLRTRLSMADNERRYARDTHALQLILASRPDTRLIVGRTGADGSPTPPSRLLAAASPEDTARRVRHLFDVRREIVSVRHRWDDGPASTRLPIPSLPADEFEVTTMSVTAFRDYLVCPYRFFLRHVLKMRPVDDATGELAANQFGDLIHGALENFGKSPDKNETEAAKIEAAMVQHLHDYAKRNYGDATAMAVKLQVKQAERRIETVARRQSERIADGWEIRMTEASVAEAATDDSDAAIIHVDGKPMGLRGRFDRIDYQPSTGRWAILDYKTHGHKPEKKHLKHEGDITEWIDLQLPLYRMMIPFLRLDAPVDCVELGYFNISEKEEQTKINIAQFDEDLLRKAEEQIQTCIRDIRDKKFEPTEERVPFDDYDMILQTGVAQSMLQMASSESDTEISE